MIRSAAKARRMFSALINRVPGLLDLVVSNYKWDRAMRICDFLETAVRVTKKPIWVHACDNMPQCF